LFQSSDNFVPLPKKPRTGGSVNDSEIASLQATINSLRESIDQIKATIETVKKQNEAALKAQEKRKLKRIRLTRPRKPLTYEDKEKLCQDIYNLREDQIPGLLAIISKYQKAVSNFPNTSTNSHTLSFLFTHFLNSYFSCLSSQYKSVTLLSESKREFE
jgi:ATP-dependent Clp protease ATP-binding subunit ClpA